MAMNAAQAMRKEREFGTIEPGKRADFLLVRSNPLESVRHLAGIESVCVRGVWLSRHDLDTMLAGLEEIFSAGASAISPKMPSTAQIDAFWGAMKKLHVEGYIFRGHDLDRLSGALKAIGNPDRSKAVGAMKLGL